jgi:hypothetical protein
MFLADLKDQENSFYGNLLVLLGLNKFNHCSVMCKTLLLNTAVA